MRIRIGTLKLALVVLLTATAGCGGQNSSASNQPQLDGAQSAVVATTCGDGTCTSYTSGATTGLLGFVTVANATACSADQASKSIVLESSTPSTGAPITVTRCTTADCSVSGEPVTVVASSTFSGSAPPAKNWGPYTDTITVAGSYYYFFKQTGSHLAKFSDAIGPISIGLDSCSSGGTDGGDPPIERTVQVTKFYDANASCNENQQGIEGWFFNLYATGDSTFSSPLSLGPSGVSGTFSFKITDYIPGATGAVVKEQLPSGNVSCGSYSLPQWVRTIPNPADSYSVVPGSSVTFGNVCLGAGGGLTLGFWSNKNGQALVSTADLSYLGSLNLVNGAGTAFDPASYSTFRSWILSATAVNMAYMLSAQLAAMELNVRHGFVNASATVYAPASLSASCGGFASIGDLMGEANASLAANPNTIAAGAARTYQAALKNALDQGNNNCNFAQSSPTSCGCSAIVDSSSNVTGYDCTGLFPTP